MTALELLDVLKTADPAAVVVCNCLFGDKIAATGQVAAKVIDVPLGVPVLSITAKFDED